MLACLGEDWSQGRVKFLPREGEKQTGCSEWVVQITECSIRQVPVFIPSFSATALMPLVPILGKPPCFAGSRGTVQGLYNVCSSSINSLWNPIVEKSSSVHAWFCYSGATVTTSLSEDLTASFLLFPLQLTSLESLLILLSSNQTLVVEVLKKKLKIH